MHPHKVHFRHHKGRKIRTWRELISPIVREFWPRKCALPRKFSRRVQLTLGSLSSTPSSHEDGCESCDEGPASGTPRTEPGRLFSWRLKNEHTGLERDRPHSPPALSAPWGAGARFSSSMSISTGVAYTAPRSSIIFRSSRIETRCSATSRRRKMPPMPRAAIPWLASAVTTF